MVTTTNHITMVNPLNSVTIMSCICRYFLTYAVLKCL